MDFKIKNIKKSINDIMRVIGYQPAYFQNDGEVSIVRKVSGGEYPRFHLYIKEISSIDSSMVLNFSLHLDQKKPSYSGSRAHSGEYDGELIEREAERIKELLK